VARTLLLLLLAVLMVAIGVQHFRDPQPFVRIVPAALPAPLLLVHVSGFFEVLGGVGLLFARTRRAAAWGLIALYVAVFPANVNMAMHQLPAGDVVVPPLLLWLRLPLQAVFIAWAWLFTREPAPRAGDERKA
jgi:uncharacterized membrane protein